MPRAILSVYDKTDLAQFGRGLNELGWTLLASGGTADFLRKNELTVIEVSQVTGLPEVLGGRVKTLHPAIHAGILARLTETDQAELVQHCWENIDLVVVNLYPFEQVVARPGATLEEAVENIDVGGVTLMRAAAKNFGRVTLVCAPQDYGQVLLELKSGGVSLDMRKRLAVKGFLKTCEYDAAISAFLMGAEAPLRISAYPLQKLRYGENPHQPAELFAFQPGQGPLGGVLRQGKELSYTNLLDLDAAWRAVVSFERPTICIVKHVSPCGIASADSPAEAFAAALASDPVSAFGGVIASNRPCDAATVQAMGSLFIECMIAPGFDPEARRLLAQRKNCRLLEMEDTLLEPGFELRSIKGGILRQEMDLGDPVGAQPWQVVSQRQPTPEEWAALRFAWKACQHVRSNAIVFAHGEATVGIGGGQPNRVDSVRIAAQRAGERAHGAVMASDAFFPFRDSMDIAAQAGIRAAIHPGGSIRDQESIDAANEHGMAMVLTGVRHFKH